MKIKNPIEINKKIIITHILVAFLALISTCVILLGWYIAASFVVMNWHVFWPEIYRFISVIIYFFSYGIILHHHIHKILG